MSNDTILVTGANGFIAGHIVKRALEAGYRVRGTVRRVEAAEKLQAYFKGFGDRAEFVVVPNLLSSDAYGRALDGVTGVIHAATPIPTISQGTMDYRKDVLDPAVKAATAILEAALTSPTIKRVVFTSSISAMVPPNLKDWPSVLGHPFDEKDLNESPIDTPVDDAFAAYNLSKSLAERAAWAFMADHPEANFDLATTLPGLVMGPNLFQTSSQEVSGSNAILWNILTNGLPYPFWQTNIHVQDIAYAHVAAVDKDKVASGRYLLNGSNEPWSYALKYVKKRWPERTWAEKETIGLPFEWDSSKAKREMGIDWIPFEKQIDDVVEQMIALGA